MQRLLLVLLITTGAISLSGCGFFSRDDVNDIVEDVTIENPSPEQSAETADSDLPNLPNGEDSTTVVEGLQNSPTVIARDLIQSTDPNERAIGVERTRNDPFAELTIPFIPPEPIEVPETSQASGNRSTPSASNSGNTPSAASRSQTTASGSSGTNANSGANSASNSQAQERPAVSRRQVESSLPEIAALPEIPQPTNARAVRVSGIIQIGGSPYAIVQAPNEIERYVRQGERIAGGSVVVKRIDTGSIEPRVILVENGIEVERFVTASDAVVEEEEEAPAAETVSTIGSLPTLPAPGI
ncbi:MAG: hypothetical protein KTR27_07605 [Leptolyngbyaceae cyanobacterium MAG.088]|nr:hypothetical protein [Leptolyngbyaceae cyanobacterium MAG.088]